MLPLDAQPEISLVARLEAVQPLSSRIGAVVVNYRTDQSTVDCLRSMTALKRPPAVIVVIDNSPGRGSLCELVKAAGLNEKTTLLLYQSDHNLGFAAGCNVGIERLFENDTCECVLLLNSDAVAQEGIFEALLPTLIQSTTIGLVGGRVHRLDEPNRVDSLGICLYSSLMPADRKEIGLPYLGPTGSCILLSRIFIEDMKKTYGYVFDPRYFCYCEDTDLALRAHLSGYYPSFVDQLVALHQGQASSQRGYNPFIAYHGFRNLIWMFIKLLPFKIFITHFHLVILAHGLFFIRHLLSGHPGLVFRAYRDALRESSDFMSERSHLKKIIQYDEKKIAALIAPGFYQIGYGRRSIEQIISSYIGKDRSKTMENKKNE